jgi:hypothetical protein
LLALYADWIPFFFTPGMTDSKDLLNAVALGRIELKPTIKEVSGSSVTFTDGTVKDFDAVVLATGFRRAVPFIHPTLRPTHRGLYKGTLHPRRPRVAYVRFIRHAVWIALSGCRAAGELIFISLPCGRLD